MAIEKASESREPTVVRVAPSGQVVIPADIASRLGFQPGDYLRISPEDGRWALTCHKGPGSAFLGILKALPDVPSTQEILDELDQASDLP